MPLPESSSFPSGHAAEGVAGLGALAVLAAERLPDRRARALLWAAVVLAGLAVGLSRIALGVHYVTDVLAGWCFGLAWLAGCLLVRDRLVAEARCTGEPDRRAATLGHVAEADGKPLDERLEEIGAQLAWVRDYL